MSSSNIHTHAHAHTQPKDWVSECRKIQGQDAVGPHSRVVFTASFRSFSGLPATIKGQVYIARVTKKTTEEGRVKKRHGRERKKNQHNPNVVALKL